MTKSVFIASAEPYSGKSLVSLGLVNMLLRKTPKVGYFKPIINFEPTEKKDAHIETIISHFGLPLTYEASYAYTRQASMRLVEANTQGEIIDTIIRKFKALEEQYDFTVVEGSDFLGAGTAFEFDANISIAKNLGAPAVLVISGQGKTTDQTVNAALTVLRNFEAREVPVLAVIVNKMPPSEADNARTLLGEQLPADIILTVIPEDQSLRSPTMQEIQEQLGGKLLVGRAPAQQPGRQFHYRGHAGAQLPEPHQGKCAHRDARRPGRHYSGRFAGQHVGELPQSSRHGAHRRASSPTSPCCA